MRVTIPSAQEVRAQSSGEVTTPETLDFRTFRPVPGGLFCEQIFGPMPEATCACGHTTGAASAGQVCSQCGVAATWRENRSRRSGHIELAVPVCHPHYVYDETQPLSCWCGLAQAELEGLVYYTLHREEQTGAEVIRELLQQAGKPDEGRAVLECVPVIPPALREVRLLDEHRMAIHEVNDLYRRVLNRNNRLRKLLELSAPVAILDQEKRRLQETVDALIDNAHAPEPVLNAQGRPMKSLADL